MHLTDQPIKVHMLLEVLSILLLPVYLYREIYQPIQILVLKDPLQQQPGSAPN